MKNKNGFTAVPKEHDKVYAMGYRKERTGPDCL